MSDEKKDTTAQDDIKLGQQIGEDQEAQKAEDKKPTEEKK